MNANKLIQSIWRYLGTKASEAYDLKDEVSFDWYADGQEAIWCVIRDRPIKINAPCKASEMISTRKRTFWQWLKRACAETWFEITAAMERVLGR